MTPTELRAWLLKHGISARELGRISGRNRRSIAYYLSGDRPIPRVFELALERIAGESFDRQQNGRISRVEPDRVAGRELTMSPPRWRR